MVNKNYNRGRGFEYRFREELRTRFPNDYIIRTAGSHSIGDILLIGNSYIFVFQLKYAVAKPTSNEIRKYLRTIKNPNVTTVVVWQKPRGDRYTWRRFPDGSFCMTRIKKNSEYPF